MKKQSRRHFIKDKLWKGLILSLFNPFSSMAKFDGSQEESITTKDDGITPDWEKVKSQFTLVNSRKHFNTASIGPSPRIVQDTTIASINYINKYGIEDHKVVEKTRAKLAKFVNVNPEQLAITRNATEGMNIVARSLKLNQGDEVIITSEEHIGGSAPWMTLQNEIGIKVKVVNILGNEGKFVKLIKSSISDRTKVISISHITCTTGTVLPVKEIIEFCKKNQIQSVIDGTQALGQISLNLKSLQPNFFIASCHKWLFGPKGTGILYMNQDFLNNTPPLFAGAYTDQKFDLKKGIYEYVKHASRYEYGTINSPIIAGLGAAVEFMDKVGIKNVEDRGKNLAERFRNKVSQHNDIFFLTPDQLDNYASIITFRIKHKNGSNVCKELRKTSNIVLRSVTENNMNAIRASFALYTNEKEVDELAQKLLIIANQ
jgi:cysteine desulfurase/selenocysteine lyase